jgi:hypothetical protein
MQKTLLRFFARPYQFALLLFVVMSAHAATPGYDVPTNVKVGERLLYVLANQERLQRGLQLLHWDTSLAASARYHAVWMARRADISHQFPGEPELTTRASKLGAHFSAIAENIAIVNDIHSAHDEWMQSPGHRANLLDPKLDSIGIAFEMRAGRFYVVQDFSRAVDSLSFAEQEQRIAQLLRSRGIKVYDEEQAVKSARGTCVLDTGWAGQSRPSFTMRWVSGDLKQIPEELDQRIASGKYSVAWIGACKADAGNGFSAYSFAVMLFTHPPQDLSQAAPQNAPMYPNQPPQPTETSLPPLRQD